MCSLWKPVWDFDAVVSDSLRALNMGVHTYPRVSLAITTPHSFTRQWTQLHCAITAQPTPRPLGSTRSGFDKEDAH